MPCVDHGGGKYEHSRACAAGREPCAISASIPIGFERAERWAMELWPMRDIGRFKYKGGPGFPFLWEGEYGSRVMGVKVICTARTEADGKRWTHVSYSRKNRIPDYEDSCRVKQLFVGADKLALALYVPEEQHVNIHPNVLHLWHCLDGDPVPDFRTDGQI